MTWTDRFEELTGYYPGSSKKIAQEPAANTPQTPPDWASSPRVYHFDGRPYEFFTIGDLARALSKQPVTIRLWESHGYLPAPLRSPSTHASARQRLYTRPQIEGIVRIAEEEGILGEARPRIEQTRFQARTLDLFLELAHQPLSGAVCLEGEP